MIQVLYVDDEPDLLLVGKLFLERLGDFQVSTVTGAREAIRYLDQNPVDVIISDYQMPGMDGLSFLRALKEDGNNIPFILFTGRGREEVVITALNYGADFYLQKGGEPQAQFAELANHIRQTVARKRAEDELKTQNYELHAAYEEIAASEEELRANIDELLAKEEIIRVSQERLIMAQEIARVGCWEYNLVENTIWGSAEGLRIFGFPPVAGDFPIEEIEACIPERKRVHQALLDLLDHGAEYNLVYLIHPLDGSEEKYIHSVARMYRDPKGNPIRVIGVIQDITYQKKNEISLQETRDYLENLISIANVPIIIWDSQFRITRMNQAFERLIGRNADEVLGKSLEILFPPDKTEWSMKLLHPAFNGIRQGTNEIEIIHRDGTRRTLVWNSAILYGQEGEGPIATIAQGYDVTEERRLEREKAAAIAQIQENLAYMAILNDEIRNPLTTILSVAETIDDGQAFRMITSQVERIDAWVSLLDKRWVESEKVLNVIRKHYQIITSRQEQGGTNTDGSIEKSD